ncbi:MAG: CPBP family intramembrane metalloprotease [Elusimicrobiota bacterium]|nr:MAG: CPBP family intramembrane metalloprotease [Elusimicrobiota bacterium]
MAPLSEEAIFRGAFQGRLAKLTAKLRMGDFVVPALITSTLFVALHETADPVLFAARMVFALALSYVYKKEGILAAMAAHGIFNGLLAVTVVFAAAGMPILSLAAAPLALWAMWRSIKLLKSQRPDIKSGALTPLPMSGLLSLLFAALLTAGYFFLMPNVFWIIGAVLLGINGFRKLRSNQ